MHTCLNTHKQEVYIPIGYIFMCKHMEMSPKENTPTVIVSFSDEAIRIGRILGLYLIYIMTLYIITFYYNENVFMITWVIKNNTSNDQWKISKQEIFQANKYLNIFQKLKLYK